MHSLKTTNLSLVILIASNLIPLIGVLFFDWNAVLVLALFWIENLIIGGFNVIKLISLSVYNKELKALFLSLFFIIHYGLFCTGHGTLLWNILNLGDVENVNYISSILGNFGALFDKAANVLFAFIDKFKPQIWFGITAITISHLVSFVENFILRGGIFTAKANKLMAEPYTQVIVLHVGLLIGALAAEKFGSPLWLLLIIIAFKISMDITQHRKRKEKEKGKKIEN